jgi:hypothetical protein
MRSTRRQRRYRAAGPAGRRGRCHWLVKANRSPAPGTDLSSLGRLRPALRASDLHRPCRRDHCHGLVKAGRSPAPDTDLNSLGRLRPALQTSHRAPPGPVGHRGPCGPTPEIMAHYRCTVRSCQWPGITSGLGGRGSPHLPGLGAIRNRWIALIGSAWLSVPMRGRVRRSVFVPPEAGRSRN